MGGLRGVPALQPHLELGEAPAAVPHRSVRGVVCPARLECVILTGVWHATFDGEF
jgi:hypothetical protein